MADENRDSGAYINSKELTPNVKKSLSRSRNTQNAHECSICFQNTQNYKDCNFDTCAPDEVMGFNLYNKHPVDDLDSLLDQMSLKSRESSRKRGSLFDS